MKQRSDCDFDAVVNIENEAVIIFYDYSIGSLAGRVISSYELLHQHQ